MYCPSPFLVNGSSCVYDCSAETGYTTKLGAQPRCVRTNAESTGFDLKPVVQVPLQLQGQSGASPLTLDQLKTAAPTFYTAFDAERTRAKGEVAVLNAQIGRDAQIATAFQRLQDAENARDQAPDAYQKARADYYTLVKGDKWVDEEKERVARAEVDPLVQRYTNEYVALTGQLANQSQAYDTMNAIKDKVFRVKDDLTYSADLLLGQVNKVQSQIALDRRKQSAGQGEPAWFVWVDMTLNVLLVVALLAAVWFIIKKLRSPKTPGSSPSPAFTEAASPP